MLNPSTIGGKLGNIFKSLLESNIIIILNKLFFYWIQGALNLLYMINIKI